MRRTILRIAIVCGALAVVGPVLASDPPTPSAAPIDAAGEATPAMQAAGLCGITQSDVNDIAAYYDLAPDMQGVQAMLATPFDCSAYGGLCGALDPVEAKTYACNVWTQLEAHTSAQFIETQAVDWLGDHAGTCPPNPAKCADMCDPYGVLVCDGIEVNGNCKQLAVCDIPKLRWLLGFDDLIIEDLDP